MFSRLAFAKTRRLLFAPARTYERPTIASVSPALGPLGGGTQIRVVGTGYTMTGDTTVTIGGAPVAVIVQSEFVLFVTTPAHAPGAVALAVTTPGGTASIAWTYQSATPAPTVSSADPDFGDVAGPHAGLMTITGSDFVSGGSFGVTIGGTAALNVTFVNATTITCRPPAKASGQYTIRVTNNDGQFGDLVNGYQAWTPSEIASVDTYFDARKGVTTVSGKVSIWDNQKTGESIVTAQQTADPTRPSLVADVFGTGVPSIRYAPQKTLDAYDNVGSPIRRAMPGGYSTFWAVKYTSSDTTAAGGPVINCPLTVYGDTGGWGSAGFYADKLTLAQFTNTIYSDGTGVADGRRGSGFNDGNAHFLGWTYSSGGIAKAYKGAAQQGADVSATYDTTNQAYNRIGVGWTAVDGFDGDLGFFVVVRGVIGATDLARLNKWARLSFGTT